MTPPAYEPAFEPAASDAVVPDVSPRRQYETGLSARTCVAYAPLVVATDPPVVNVELDAAAPGSATATDSATMDAKRGVTPRGRRSFVIA